MTTATAAKVDLGWVEVSATIEPRAIAGLVSMDAAGRIAETLIYTLGACEEDGHELNDRQKMVLVEGLLRCWDGFEGETYETLLKEFKIS